MELLSCIIQAKQTFHSHFIYNFVKHKHSIFDSLQVFLSITGFVSVIIF